MRSGSFEKVLPYLAAQMLGGLAGATIVWLHYFPHWKETEDKILKLRCFSTGPAIRSALPNLLSEVIATFVLVFVAGAIFSKAVATGGLASGLGPYLVGSLVWGVGLSLGGTTGYAINPARDFGPRLAHAILPIAGKGDSDWSYASIPLLVRSWVAHLQGLRSGVWESKYEDNMSATRALLIGSFAKPMVERARKPLRVRKEKCFPVHAGRNVGRCPSMPRTL